MSSSIILNKKIELVFQTNGSKSHFFGYYDKSPFDSLETNILSHSVNFDHRLFNNNDIGEIGIWNIRSGQYTCIDHTNAMNWQQGSMLQWLPNKNENSIIFNLIQNNQVISKTVNIKTHESNILPISIYSLSPNGSIALSPKYERLIYCHPGYSYEIVPDTTWDGFLPKDDGIYKLDINTGQVDLVIRVSDLVEEGIKDNYHFVEHIMFSPNGEKFIFYHRWFNRNEAQFTRLYISDLNGNELSMYPDSGFYSHANWIDNNTFAVWGRLPSLYTNMKRSTVFSNVIFKKLLKFYRSNYKNKFVNIIKKEIAEDQLLLYTIGSKKTKIIEKILQDGHPSINPVNRDLLLIDTYEKSDSYRYLYIYSFKNDIILELGRFYSPNEFNQTGFRCDLHPRWSPSGNLICVDTIISDKRQMIILDVTEFIKEFIG